MSKMKEEACKKLAAKVAADHAGQPKPKLLHRKPNDEQILASLKGKVTKMMHINGVRWNDPGDGWGRETCGFTITVDFTKLDRAPTKEDVVKSIQKDLNDISDRGWYYYEILRKSRIWIEQEVPIIRQKVDGTWPVIPCLETHEIKDRRFVRKEDPKKPTCKCGGKCHCKKGKK